MVFADCFWQRCLCDIPFGCLSWICQWIAYYLVVYALASKILASASQTNRVGKFHRLPSGGGSTCITDALRYLSRDAQYVPRASVTFASVLTPRWVLLASVSGRIPIIERGHEIYKGEKNTSSICWQGDNSNYKR